MNPLNLRRHAVKAWRRTATKRVFASYDASQREMKHAVHSFAVTLRERDKEAVTFIFQAGHGVQVRGENYLISQADTSAIWR